MKKLHDFLKGTLGSKYDVIMDELTLTKNAINFTGIRFTRKIPTVLKLEPEITKNLKPIHPNAKSIFYSEEETESDFDMECMQPPRKRQKLSSENSSTIEDYLQPKLKYEPAPDFMQEEYSGEYYF